MEIPCDDAVFQAALAFVDTFESHTSTSATTRRHERRGAASGAVTNAKRVRSELISLRAEVTRLELFLTTLQRAQTTSRPTSSTAIAKVAWKALAMRQRKRRHNAEVENLQLRTLLEQHVRTARRLEKLLKKSSYRDDDQSTVLRLLTGGASAEQRHFTLDFDGLTTYVHVMETQLHTVFRAPWFPIVTTMAEPVQDLVERTDPAYGHVAEMTESRIFPVRFRVLSDAMWRHVVETPTRGVRVQDTSVTDTSIQREATFQIGPANKVAHPTVFHCKSVGRRAQYDTADVLFWAMEVNAGDRHGTTVERFWMIVRPMTISGDDDAASPVSVVQSYMVSTPVHDDRAAGRVRATTEADQYLEHRRTHMDEHWDQIDALLLDTSYPTEQT